MTAPTQKAETGGIGEARVEAALAAMRNYWDELPEYTPLDDAMHRGAVRAALSAADAVAQEGAVAWPGPIISNPDIARPTGHAYIDSLIHRLLDAQQDINFAANEQMSQSLCDACAVIDEAEAAFRLLATNPKASALAAAREQGRRETLEEIIQIVLTRADDADVTYTSHDNRVGAFAALMGLKRTLCALLPPAPDAEKPEDTAK